MTVQPVTLEQSSPELLKDTKEEKKGGFMAFMASSILSPYLRESTQDLRVTSITLLYLL